MESTNNLMGAQDRARITNEQVVRNNLVLTLFQPQRSPNFLLASRNPLQIRISFCSIANNVADSVNFALARPH